MDRNGYDTFWMAEHHFQREGYECIPNVLMLALHLCHLTKNIKYRLRLQHRADVAPAPDGRGLRHRRHPDQRPRRLRRRARLPHPRGRGLRRADARPGRQPRAVRGAGRDHLEGVQRALVLAPGQALHDPARRAVPGLRAGGDHAGAAPEDAARRVLAAGRQRQPARARLHGQARHQGHHRRRRGAGGANEQVVQAFRRRAPAPAGRPSWAAICASASRSTSPTARSRASRRRRRSSRRTSRCSRRSASCAA